MHPVAQESPTHPPPPRTHGESKRPPVKPRGGGWVERGGGGGGGGGGHAHPSHQQAPEGRDIKAAIRQSFEELTRSELCQALVKEGLELTPTLANNRKGIIDILCDLQDMPSLVLANQ